MKGVLGFTNQVNRPEYVEEIGPISTVLNSLSQYQNIISNHADGIYSDEALYFSAEIYNKKLNEPEKAKPLYEQIIFNHEDSIYFVEARKSFRKLRGDTNL